MLLHHRSRKQSGLFITFKTLHPGFGISARADLNNMAVPKQGIIKACLEVGLSSQAQKRESFCNTGDWGSIPGQDDP